MGKDSVSKTKDVRAAVEKELGFDPGVDATHIAVRNIVSDVTLTGTVPSYPQYLEAAAAARRVAGVTSVHNHLEVALPEGNYRDDAMLTTAANETLAQNVTVPDGVEATARDVFEVIREGMVKVEVRHTYPLAEAERVHRDLEGRRTVGSIVMMP